MRGKKGKTQVDTLTEAQTDARWASFLAGAYGAWVDDRDLAVEKKAIAIYDKTFTGKKDSAGKLLGPLALIDKAGKLLLEQTQRAWNLVQQSALAQTTNVRALPSI